MSKKKTDITVAPQGDGYAVRGRGVPGGTRHYPTLSQALNWARKIAREGGAKLRARLPDGSLRLLAD